MKRINDPVKEAILELKTAILNLENEGEELHEGPLADLARVMWRIVHNYEHEGIQYVVHRYWQETTAQEATVEDIEKEIAYIQRQIRKGKVGTPNVYVRLADLERVRDKGYKLSFIVVTFNINWK